MFLITPDSSIQAIIIRTNKRKRAFERYRMVRIVAKSPRWSPIESMGRTVGTCGISPDYCSFIPSSLVQPSTPHDSSPNDFWRDQTPRSHRSHIHIVRSVCVRERERISHPPGLSQSSSADKRASA